MTVYTFTHDGHPKAKERPRVGNNTRKLYTPSSTLMAERELRRSYDGPFFKGAIRSHIVFHPEYTEITLADWDGPLSALRGDGDNYEKLVFDALKSVAFKDDRQVMASYWVKAA